MIRLLNSTLFLSLLSGTLLFSQEQRTYDPNATAESLQLESYVLPDDFYPNYPWEWFPAEHLPYETRETSLPGVVDCGYSMAGFVPPEHLWRCNELGLKTFVAISGATWHTMTDKEINERIRETVEKSKDNDCVIGY